MSIRAGLLLLVIAAPPLAAAGGTPRVVVDDFESGDRVSRSGAAWAPFSDAILGGASTVRLEVHGSTGHRALRGTAHVAAQGFGGTWVALDREARAVDLKAFSAIRLRLRGAGAWLVGLRGGTGRFDNYMAPVEGSGEWKTFDVPLASLRSRNDEAFVAGDVRWLGVQTAAGRAGDAVFEIDDVELVGADRLPEPHGAPLQAHIARTPAASLANVAWKPAGTDPRGDGKAPSLPDVVELATWSDASVVWFRITLAAPPGAAFGANLALDVDGDATNGSPWWGVNTAFRFDTLVTAWVLDTTSDAFDGTIGIASAADAVAGRPIDPKLGAPRLAVDADAKRVYVGVPRAVLGTSASVRVVVAVGSPMKHNDDLPDTGAVTVTP